MSMHPFRVAPPSALDRAGFVARYGGVYEHSPWIAERAHDGGLGAEADHAEGLSAALRAVVEAAGRERQLALLRAHPDLAGRLAVAGALTAESTSEQAGAGLDRCTAEEFARFQSLNDRYTGTFGFPFIMAVKGYDRRAILGQFETRVGNDPETEFRTALDQVHRIALLRLIAIAEEA
ncbi:2-oxo-4-hydroxy-4-carboxy-5-ureidoimidazoline decarboxylase [Oceanibacterium hippocampi]|uniref:2-oxo-4-hydroxy-4-carboxy-5-ureidoimidazoline decarboxylase n=1 Tax=Oceanibacterium hippocampi TaxID=745714 RepID=A0A1Y5U372_9PROT|nr:2-oxo-4-hydroxy-4-carboxy-5-ureidoimidazoline decarboxylase [Oceanibacterium hippocampi]SLN76067.1 Uric acid degradation bifunctional protein [Oceanibacterium hippocampi]